MERHFFITTYPHTKFYLKPSLGVNLLTNIQLLDYFINRSSKQSQRVKELARKLPDPVKEDLRILRTVFAHSVILRNYYIKHAEDIDQTWPEFISWWEGLREEQILDLIIFGIQEAIDYYYKFMEPIASVEKTLKGVDLGKEALKNDLNRKQALIAVLQSWSVEEIHEVLPIYQDLAEVKTRIIHLIKGFWQFGFQEIWQKTQREIENWITRNQTLIHQSYGTNEEAIFKITGLYPATKEIEQINRAEFLTFIPVTNMGRLLTICELENHIFLMFEPAKKEETNQPADVQMNDVNLALEGLGDSTRLQIIHLLTRNKEMYAQQIVNELDINQSTVSRHLNQLYQAGLVTIRQEGNTKYFSINKETIKRVIQVLETFLQ